MRYHHHIYFNDGTVCHRSDDRQLAPEQLLGMQVRFLIHHVATKGLWRVYETERCVSIAPRGRWVFRLPPVSRVPTFDNEDAAIAYVGLKL